MMIIPVGFKVKIKGLPQDMESAVANQDQREAIHSIYSAIATIVPHTREPRRSCPDKEDKVTFTCGTAEQLAWVCCSVRQISLLLSEKDMSREDLEACYLRVRHAAADAGVVKSYWPGLKEEKLEVPDEAAKGVTTLEVLSNVVVEENYTLQTFFDLAENSEGSETSTQYAAVENSEGSETSTQYAAVEENYTLQTFFDLAENSEGSKTSTQYAAVEESDTLQTFFDLATKKEER